MGLSIQMEILRQFHFPFYVCQLPLPLAEWFRQWQTTNVKWKMENGKRLGLKNFPLALSPKLPSFSRLCQRRFQPPCAPRLYRILSPAGGRNPSPDAECAQSPPTAQPIHPGSSPKPTGRRARCISGTRVRLSRSLFRQAPQGRVLALAERTAPNTADPDPPAGRLHALCAAP